MTVGAFILKELVAVQNLHEFQNRGQLQLETQGTPDAVLYMPRGSVSCCNEEIISRDKDAVLLYNYIVLLYQNAMLRKACCVPPFHHFWSEKKAVISISIVSSHLQHSHKQS